MNSRENQPLNQYHPDFVLLPGETLRKTLEALGLSQGELARQTGIPKKTLSEILWGRKAITAKTALQFEKILGVPASFWINLEQNYQESLARLTGKAKAKNLVHGLEKEVEEKGE